MKKTHKITVIALGVSCLLLMSTGTIFASGHRSNKYYNGGCGNYYNNSSQSYGYSSSNYNSYYNHTTSRTHHASKTTTTHINSQHMTNFDSYDTFAKNYLADNLTNEQIKVAKDYYAKLKEIDFTKNPSSVQNLCLEMMDLNLLLPNSHFTHNP